jgi:hypothetical protein
MNGDKTYLVCLPVRDDYVPPVLSSKARCDKCGAQVWRAHSSPQDALPLCISCLKAQTKRGGEVEVKPPSAQQLVDMLGHLATSSTRERTH